MAGGSSSSKPAAQGRKRVEATVHRRSRDGSAFTRCETCNKDVPVVLIDMHSCSLDSKIRMTLEAQVVEKTVEVNNTERKRPAASAATKAAKRAKEDLPPKGKRKRSPTAFFLFMEDFRKEYKAAHPDNKSVSTVAKEGGERWRSMTDQEKKPYIDKAAELKVNADNGEATAENNVAVEKGEVADDEEEQVDQPPNHDDGEQAGDQEDEEKNELDDDI